MSHSFYVRCSHFEEEIKHHCDVALGDPVTLEEMITHFQDRLPEGSEIPIVLGCGERNVSVETSLMEFDEINGLLLRHLLELGRWSLHGKKGDV